MRSFHFNRDVWSQKVTQKLWYTEIPELFKQSEELRQKDEGAFQNFKEEVYTFFESELSAGNIFLGDNVGFFDQERKPIDTVVIHHTSNPPGLTKERLSAIELVRLYAPNFANPGPGSKTHVPGEAIYSGHVRAGRQVFYPYHWIVRTDGSTEQLLLDTETGWHAGDWDVNCRSVAIVFDNDYENSRPSDVELKAAAKIIREKYPHVKKEDIVGHREVNSKTTCPSSLFLSQNDENGHVLQRGWKYDLLDLFV